MLDGVNIGTDSSVPTAAEKDPVDAVTDVFGSIVESWVAGKEFTTRVIGKEEDDISKIHKPMEYGDHRNYGPGAGTNAVVNSIVAYMD